MTEMTSLLETSEVLKRANINRNQLFYMQRVFPGLISCVRKVAGRYRLWSPGTVETIIQLRSGMCLDQWGNATPKKPKDSAPVPAPVPII